MKLRLLQYFLAVAEELHLGRAAGRLGIEQSPLSRAMRDLEQILGIQLFDRSFRQTTLTWAGQTLLTECRYVLAAVDRAVNATRAAANGYKSTLRIAIADGLAGPRMATLLAVCRAEEPDMEIRLVEMPYSQQLRGLHEGLLDIAFSFSSTEDGGLHSSTVWAEPLALILPARHPLLRQQFVRLDDALSYPVVMCHPEEDSGFRQQLQAIFKVTKAPKIVDQASSFSVMLTLIGAGYGVGFGMESQMNMLRRADISVRGLTGVAAPILVHLLRRHGDPSEPVKRFT
jgi:DNA-binding transcriptional LysR family regulator